MTKFQEAYLNLIKDYEIDFEEIIELIQEGLNKDKVMKMSDKEIEEKLDDIIDWSHRFFESIPSFCDELNQCYALKDEVFEDRFKKL